MMIRAGHLPGGSMRLPGTKAHPAEVKPTLLAYHVVTAPILLYSSLTLGTFLKTNIYVIIKARLSKQYFDYMYYICIKL